MKLALPVINEIFDRLGWPQVETIEVTPQTDEIRKVVTLLNRVLRTIQGIDDWARLRREGTLLLLASESSDVSGDPVGSEQYVTATQDSTTVTVANMTFDDTYKGRAFQVVGDEYIYRIEDVLSATQITLNRAWVSDSIVPADERTFVIAMDRYALPVDFDRPTDDWLNFFDPTGIKPVNPNQFAARRRREEGGSLIAPGDPQVFTIYDLNQGQTTEIVHFDPFPNERRLLTFQYMANHPEITTDNDKILYPERYLEFVITAVVELALRHYEDSAKADQTLMDMIREYNWQTKTVVDTIHRMTPSGKTRAQFQRAYGSGGARINWGSAFDIAGNVNLD